MHKRLTLLICLLPLLVFGQNEAATTDTLKPQSTPEINSHLEKYRGEGSIESTPLNQVGIMHLQSVYSDNIKTIGQTSVQYLRKSKDLNWTFIGRVTMRNRVDQESFKYTFETYLKHGKKSYSFAGISFSDQKLFPKFEANYSLYNSFDKGWELETGAKFLSAENFSLFTPIVGLSKELATSRITLRNYLTFAESSMYYGNSLTWKEFLNDNRDNISFMTGFGNGPDSKSLDFTQEFITNKTFFVGIGGEKKIKPFTLSASTVFNTNNYSTGQRFNQFDFYLNLFYDF